LKLWTTSLLALALVGCGTPPEGSYVMTAKRTAGSCSEAGTSGIVTVDADNVMHFAGTSDTCQLDATGAGACDVTTGTLTIASLWRLDFTGDGFTGTVEVVHAPVVEGFRVWSMCRGTYALTGTRQ
jgi:hypothetical protein